MPKAKPTQRVIVVEIAAVIDPSLTDEQAINNLLIKGKDKAVKVTSYGIADPEPA